MDPKTARTLRFGAFEADMRTGELRKYGLKIRLQHQSFQILLMLLERPGDVVLRDEIRRRLWPDDTIVEFDHSINAAMKRLRNALGESAEAPRYIETLARRGYRFLGEVESVGAATPEIAFEGPQNGRGQSAPERKPELQGATEMLPAQQPAPARSSWSGRLTWISGIALAIFLVALIAPGLRKKPAEVPLVRFPVFPPENTVFGNYPGPAVSPDGHRIVFAALPTSGEGWELWLRSLDAVTPVPLAGTERGSLPFWSPDSQSVAFFADGKLKRIDLGRPPGAEQAVTLCSAEDDAGGSWNADGVILFGTSRGPIYRVPDTGGFPTPATQLEQGRQENSHVFPWFLPDGRHFLFEAVARPLPPNHVTIRIGSLDSQQSKVLLEADSTAIFAQGRLLYVRENTLMAQPFDPRNLRTTAEPAPVSPVAAAGLLDGLGSFSASEKGPLVYFAGTGEPPFELLWFDHDGNELSASGGVRIINYPQYPLALSPDQRTIAFANRELSNIDIWLQDVAQGLRTRFTFDPANEIAPVWSADSRNIAFSSSRKGHFDLYRRAADGSEPEELLYADAHDKYPTSWSPDGKFLLYDILEDKQPRSTIWVLPLARKQPNPPFRPFAFLNVSFTQRRAQFSPDGRWVAYESEESGRSEIYLVPFRVEGADPACKRQISTTGGELPRWRKDGGEIFYRSGRKLMAVRLNVKGATVQVGEARQVIGPLSILGYDVTSDWQRVLVMTRNRRLASQPLTVVQSWSATLKK